MSSARISRPGCGERRARHRAFELADVAGPGVRHEPIDGVAGERLGVERQAARGAVARKEALREHRNVHRPLAQRGQANRERVDAVEQVFAEASVAHEEIERAVRRRDQPEVDGNRSVAAESLESPFLEHAQQLRLRDDREVADLVEEEGALVGHLEASGLAIVGAR